MPQFTLCNHILTQAAIVTAEQMHCHLLCNYIIEPYFCLKALSQLVPRMNHLRIRQGYVAVMVACSISPSTLLILWNFIELCQELLWPSPANQEMKIQLKAIVCYRQLFWVYYQKAEDSAHVEREYVRKSCNFTAGHCSSSFASDFSQLIS